MSERIFVAGHRGLETELLTAVRAVIHADSDPVRQDLFAALKQTKAAVRSACWLHAQLGRTWASSLFVSAYGLNSWLATRAGAKRQPDILGVFVHENARRRLLQLSSVFGDESIDLLRIDRFGALRLASAGRLLRMIAMTQRVRTLIRIVHRINQKYDFLVCCRVASLLGHYIHFREILTRERPKAVLVSSDSNPEEIGLCSVARSLLIPTIFVSHAYPTSVSPRLNFDLSILPGLAALDTYKKKGDVSGAVFLGGVEGESRPMQTSRLKRPAPVIGIFAPKVVNLAGLAEMIDCCQKQLAASQIIIRWHPSMIGKKILPDRLANSARVLEACNCATLYDVASLCDWVIADAGSNVHLELLKIGIPTLAVSAIGILRADQVDLYGFVTNNIVFPLVSALDEMTLERAANFYSGTWEDRFRRFDVGYLTSGRNPSALREAIKGVVYNNR